MEGYKSTEEYLSQLPALQVLINLGFTYLSPKQVAAARGGKSGNLLLEDILRERLKQNNRIQHKGQTFRFSEENIQTAIQRLKNVRYDGLLKTNEAVYDLLTLGVALEQSVEGDSKSFTLNYIDWRDWTANDYHVCAEFPVERNRSTEVCRADLVLFVNGIPFAVIECKAPQVEVEQAVSQCIRNQRDEYIPKLFSYVQLTVATNKNEVRYATIGTPKKFWAVWKEDVAQAELRAVVDKPLSTEAKSGLYDFVAEGLGVSQERAPYRVERAITAQDRALYSLCRPERLLTLALQFTVFDGGIRKIARYQQFFAIQRILQRVKHRDELGRRQGGIVWHTQGSGKSLTMVMLARALAMDPEIRNPRIVLVTDRVDLDKQLGNTFAACGLSPDRADSGRHLLELVSESKAHIVTTLIHKFDKALAVKKHVEDSANIFVLVDESHRTNFGSFAARMRQMFPMACYLGFTGTPLLKKEKNNFSKFGGLIDAYTISQAVQDGAVVPLLYEARHVEMEPNSKAIDTWFERHTQGLNDAQKADLKRKYSRAETLNKAEQVIYMRAFDISEDFRQNWQGTGFKAQLVAPGKAAALAYQAVLNELGHVTSEVIISPPDIREGNEETDEAPTDAVVAFWEKMIKRYGSEEEYNKQVINQFKHSETPEILIVVDKLLTGFDAPRNTVLYLTRKLREHTLLQAIARVNRLYDDEDGARPKDFGHIVDYAGVLGELDHALTTYNALADFDEADLNGALSSINEEVARLPQRHADLLDLFKTIANRNDEESYELLLGDEKLRHMFYERLHAYAKTLSIAMSSERFVLATPDSKLAAYKNDLRRFANLRAAVKLRYAEAIDYRDFEAKIRKLLDTHIAANDVLRLNEPVNIFDEQAFNQALAEQGQSKSTAAKADMIAHATKKAISERLEQDPAFYEKFSKLIQQTIDDFRAQRISDLEYLNRVSELKDAVVHRRSDDAPAELSGNEHATALYGVLKPYVAAHVAETERAAAIAAETAIDMWAILQRNWKVGYWADDDAQRRTQNEFDDYLYDVVKGEKALPLSTDEMDAIMDDAMQLARHRMVG
ncbi:Type I restriction-modification system, R subunit [Cupriavidus taiwanensis]|uniref:Type I restriction enzyme endonuclease subunit n=1 Tax=Cupriavidus taiwanensis TaxID=164546 RepID=A0A9Q7URE2_9BURK|nr:HsdR family type I site-specific deoxyribonuclease [Cupriavidus taiwanensis]SPD63252.1 Type I restriction-modification system, R subunit [Cupriavidus taiwanensis]